MAQYINLGVTCSAFSGETLPTGLSTVYVLNVNNVPLNPSGALTDSGYPVISATPSVSFNYNSVAFNVYFNEELVRSDSGRQNWRYLSSSPLTYNSSLNNRTISASSWPNPATYPLTVTHPANGAITYSLVNAPTAASNTWIQTNIVVIPSTIGGISGITGSTPIYLYQKTSTSIYLKTDGTTVNPSSPGGSAAGIFYFVYSYSGTSITLGLSATIGGIPVNSLTLSYVSNTLEATYSATQYTLTTITPAVGENPAGFPNASSTLLKHVKSGKYMYWNGISTSGPIIQTTPYTSTSSPSLSLIDYWQSGIISAQIMQGMQFKFWDLTGTTNVSTSTGESTLKDWYGWLVVKNPGFGPSFTNTTNIAITQDNTLYIGTGNAGTTKGYGPVVASATQYPSNYEGWVFKRNASDASTSNVQIMYVRNSTIPASGYPSQIGYLTSPDNTQIQFVASATTPISSDANNFQCYTCTSATNQYCNPIAGGSTPIAPAITISMNTATDWFFMSSNTFNAIVTLTGINSDTEFTLGITGKTLAYTSYTAINNDPEVKYVLSSGTYSPSSVYNFSLTTNNKISSPQTLTFNITDRSTKIGTIVSASVNRNTLEGYIRFQAGTLQLSSGSVFSVYVNNSDSIFCSVVNSDTAIFASAGGQRISAGSSISTLPINAYIDDNRYFPSDTLSSGLNVYEDFTSTTRITSATLSASSKTGTVTFNTNLVRNVLQSFYIIGNSPSNTGTGISVTSPSNGASSTTFNIATTYTFTSGTRVYLFFYDNSISRTMNMFAFNISA